MSPIFRETNRILRCNVFISACSFVGPGKLGGFQSDRLEDQLARLDGLNRIAGQRDSQGTSNKLNGDDQTLVAIVRLENALEAVQCSAPDPHSLTHARKRVQ